MIYTKAAPRTPLACRLATYLDSHKTVGKGNLLFQGFQRWLRNRSETLSPSSSRTTMRVDLTRMSSGEAREMVDRFWEQAEK